MLSRQAWFRSAALIIALVAPALAAHAQTSPAVVGHDAAAKSFHLRAGSGIALADRVANTANALIGVDWQPRGSQFSLRMGIDYSRREWNYDQIFADFDRSCAGGICEKSRVLQLAGVSLDGRFDIMTRRFRPYVVGGVSLNRATSDVDSNHQCDNNDCVRMPPGQFALSHETVGTWGIHSGVGLSVQVGPSQLFAELRFHVLKEPYWGNENRPMMLGVRF
jgi:hypothetical protein